MKNSRLTHNTVPDAKEASIRVAVVEVKERFQDTEYLHTSLSALFP